MKSSGIIAVIGALAFSAGAQGQGMKGMDMKDMPHGSAHSAPQAQNHVASGTVTKADPATRKVTIRHGAVASLNWPAMSMGFNVEDKALLDKLKPGAKVDFSFVDTGKGYVITQVR